MQNKAVPKTARMDRIAERAKAAMLRSAEMEQIMATIAEQFVCYQYDDRSAPFRDGGWDLFFWCNCFFNTMPDHGSDGRDYSYFTLSFNEQHTAEKRKEICDSVLALINEKFPANPHLDIALQYSALLDYTRIKAETAAVTPKLIGKTCSFRGKMGASNRLRTRFSSSPKGTAAMATHWMIWTFLSWHGALASQRRCICMTNAERKLRLNVATEIIERVHSDLLQ